MMRQFVKLLIPLFVICLDLFAVGDVGNAQPPAPTNSETTESPTPAPDEENATIETPSVVGVEPVASDQDIAVRLGAILRATQWFEDPRVHVEEGVVFLDGRTKQQRYREWAERLASKTQDVVATVNRIRVVEASVWDVSPAWSALDKLIRDAVRLIPFLVVGLAILLLFGLLTRFVKFFVRGLARRNIESKLLQDVAGTAAVIATLLVGIYVALRVSGLTQLALTIAGGTGLIGLAIGFAFRDIAENYLASILISLNRPFRIGDLVEIDGREGFVQRVTTRGTLLMTPGGDHVHLPNSTVYKSVVINFTASENSQVSFVVGIGYDDEIQEAQRVIQGVLKKHSAVLEDPPPMILVVALGASTVDLNVMFWINVRKYSKLKVPSAVMRQVKQALQDAEISMPDSAREVTFPTGVPVRILDDRGGPTPTEQGQEKRKTARTEREVHEVEPATTDAEAGLESEAEVIEQQARASDPLDLADNLIG